MTPAPSPTAGAPTHDARAARRDLAILLTGTGVSTVGGSLSLLAVMVHLEPSGAAWVAAALGAELVPIALLAPLVGRLVDRVSNRPLLVAATLLQGVAVLLAALVGLGPGREGVVVGALVLLGVGTALSNPVIAALLPRVTGEERATRAYGWFSMISQTGFLVGFAVAGLLVEATSVRTALLVDAASYGVLAVAVLAVRTHRRPERTAGADDGGLWLGFARLRTDRVLLLGVGGLAAATLVSVVVNVADVFYVLGDVGAGPGAYGVVTALWPAAGVLGGWAAGRLVGQPALFRALAAAVVLMGVGLLVTGSVVSIVAVGTGWVLGGAANAAQRVALNALVRARTADAERGRVFAAVSGGLQVANLVGLAVGAGVVAAIGARASLLVSGAVTVAVGAALLVAGRARVADPTS
ncbi:MFS transporter [Actinotalea sp. AC32]|nr:MFS transporter [Actinotalea sp. AC32]